MPTARGAAVGGDRGRASDYRVAARAAAGGAHRPDTQGVAAFPEAGSRLDRVWLRVGDDSSLLRPHLDRHKAGLSRSGHLPASPFGSERTNPNVLQVSFHAR